jgi:SAM-dependent methyltransferase
MDKHGKLFNKIAPYYQLFFKYQVWYYSKILKNNNDYFKDKDIKTVLDIGCGTGAFGYVFKEQGYDVKGIDVAEEMVKRGLNNNLECEKGDISKGLSFKDNSFDIVITAMVAHGLDKKKREILYKEAKRISKKVVLIQDYKFERKFFVDLIERLEGGGYFNYIENGQEQLFNIFDNVTVKEVSRNLNWYISENF